MSDQLNLPARFFEDVPTRPTYIGTSVSTRVGPNQGGQNVNFNRWLERVTANGSINLSNVGIEGVSYDTGLLGVQIQGGQSGFTGLNQDGTLVYTSLISSVSGGNVNAVMAMGDFNDPLGSTGTGLSINVTAIAGTLNQVEIEAKNTGGTSSINFVTDSLTLNGGPVAAAPGVSAFQTEDEREIARAIIIALAKRIARDPERDDFRPFIPNEPNEQLRFLELIKTLI